MVESRTVHIVDDDPDILASISFMLKAEGMATTCHDSAVEFIASLPSLEPGCILLDILMPGMSGLDLQKCLTDLGCRMPVIIITGHGDVDAAVSSMKQGAVDFIQKPFDKADLMDALDVAWKELERPVPSAADRRHAEDLLDKLTQREFEVVSWLAKGHANKNIAYEMSISPRTVELYRANAMRKLEVRSLSELLHIAFSAGVSAT